MSSVQPWSVPREVGRQPPGPGPQLHRVPVVRRPAARGSGQGCEAARAALALLPVIASPGSRGLRHTGSPGARFIRERANLIPALRGGPESNGRRSLASTLRLTPVPCVGGKTGPRGRCRRMWHTDTDWE